MRNMFVFLKDIKKSILIAFTVLCLNVFFLSCSKEGILEQFLLENIVEYTVTFNSVDGSSVDSQTVNEGSRVTKPADPIKAGYKFLSWTNSVGEEYDFSITAVTNDLMLGAKWIRIYTIIFDSDGGSSVNSQSVKEGTDMIEPTDPIRDGYEFLFWANNIGEEYDFSLDITNDITLTAQWVRVYEVSFSSLNGLNLQDTTVREGSNAIEPPDPIRNGYVFEHWSTNTNINEIGDAYDFAIAVSNDIRFYAKWTLDPAFNSFTLTINYNDNLTSDQSITVASDDTLFNQNLLDPKHPDSAYDFYGWYTTAAAEEGDEYDENAPITSDVTVYAKWLTDDLEKIVYLKQIPVDLSEYDQLTRNVLSLYEVGAEVEARYVDDQAQGTGLGDKWANASDNLGQIITDITDASESKVYVVLVTGETHTPAATIGTKNHVAVIGGYDPDGSWERPPGARTVFDGENQRRLFAATAGIDRTALFYDIEIYKGKGSVATSDSGYGMRLDTASPTLWKVIFNNNGDGVQSGSGGGLTLVEFSYPVLIDVEFRNNQVKTGGALFVKNSSIILSNVEFNNNKSKKDLFEDGRGVMYVLIEKDHDLGKYPDMILDGVTFSANEGSQGGGLAIVGEPNLDNDILPITVKNAEFKDNTSTSYGGGVYIKNLNAFFENTTFANNRVDGRIEVITDQVQQNPPFGPFVNVYTTNIHEGFGGAIYNDGTFLTFVNTTFYNNAGIKGALALMRNTDGSPGQAPRLNLINVTASGNPSSDADSAAIHIDNAAYHTPTGEGSSVWLINSIFSDSGNKPLVFIDNKDSDDYEKHNLYLLYSTVDKDYAALNEPSGSAAIMSENSDISQIGYFHYGMVDYDPILGMLDDNGGRVRTMSVASDPRIDDGGLYIQWRKDISRFYYSEDNSHWYADINENGLASQIGYLPAEAERLNYTDARGFDRVGSPGLGAFENQ